MLVLSVFPQVGFALSSAFGFMAAVNFVMAFFVFVLIAKCLTMSCRISVLESKLRGLAQQVAVDHVEPADEQRTGRRPS